MKKIAFILIFISLNSCLGVRKIVEKKTISKEIEKTDLKTDSVNLLVKNNPINDKIDISVPESKTPDLDFNKAVNDRVDEILSKLNTSKTSGDNSYKLYYNLLKRQLNFEANIGETLNEKTNVSSEKTSEKSFEQQTDEYISKKVSRIPWWLYVIAAVWFGPIIVNKIKFFTDPLAMLLKK